jgi:integrase
MSRQTGRRWRSGLGRRLSSWRYVQAPGGGELAGLGVLDRIRIQDDCATLRPAPGFVPKVGSARNVNRVIRLEAFSPGTATRRRGEEFTLLCPLRALRIYLDKTRRVRRCDRLFVAYAAWREGQPIRAPTMATWLRQVITDAYVVAGIPAPQVRAHSIRATATSLAEVGGASMEDICEAATWAGPNTFARHYRMGLHRGGVLWHRTERAECGVAPGSPPTLKRFPVECICMHGFA